MFFALIEDSMPIAQLISVTLQMQGHSLMHFSDGASFLASVQTTSYDFILVDFNLPGTVSGLQVISFLQESMSDVPALVITAVSEWLLKDVRTKYPQLFILHKPFHIQELLQSIERVQRSPIHIAFGELVNDEFLRDRTEVEAARIGNLCVK